MILKKGTALLALAAALALAGCTPGANAGSGSEGSAAGSAALQGSAAVEEVPAEEPEEEVEPAVQHDFECEWFYVDVPDTWVYDDSGASPVEGGPTLWYVTQVDETTYEFGQSSWAGSNPYEGDYYNAGGATVTVGGSNGTSLAGTLPDGREVWLNEASAGFFGDGLATITLKTDEA